eukprot:TRINITY_DN32741_c0_g1_i1.p2 TRINITY_DN32741_c0_g1~~TRINITY_DN32741_c0_g1_i1.p2  ORF type:complete len:168 (+),score=18.01 TRINITY_DN32741_c0_g1_i1:255-758(+)
MDVPYGKFHWMFAYVPEEWLLHYSNQYDCGIIVYLQRIHTSSCLPYAPECGGTTYKLNLLAYPGDKKPHYTMWYTNCTNVQFQCHHGSMHHTCGTIYGMSGGPLFVYRTTKVWNEEEGGEEEQEEYSIRAIHLGGNLITKQNRAAVIAESGEFRFMDIFDMSIHIVI